MARIRRDADFCVRCCVICVSVVHNERDMTGRSELRPYGSGVFVSHHVLGVFVELPVLWVFDDVAARVEQFFFVANNAVVKAALPHFNGRLMTCCTLGINGSCHICFEISYCGT